MIQLKSYGGLPKVSDLLARAIRDVGHDPSIEHSFELTWDYDTRAVVLKITPSAAGSSG